MSATENLYQVQSIVGKRDLRGKIYYQVHWKGYSKEYDSWEPEENLVSCDELIEEYERDTASKSGIPKASRISTENPSEVNGGIEIPLKPKRGSSSRHTKDSKTKQKTGSTTAGAISRTPPLIKEVESVRYNLRSTSKRNVATELGDNNCNALHISASNNSDSTTQSAKPLSIPDSQENAHKAQPDICVPDVSQIKTQLELQFDSNDTLSVQPISSVADKTNEHSDSVSSSITNDHKRYPVVLDGQPNFIGSAECYFALSIVLIGIVGYVLTSSSLLS